MSRIPVFGNSVLTSISIGAFSGRLSSYDLETENTVSSSIKLE